MEFSAHRSARGRHGEASPGLALVVAGCAGSRAGGLAGWSRRYCRGSAPERAQRDRPHGV